MSARLISPLVGGVAGAGMVLVEIVGLLSGKEHSLGSPDVAAWVCGPILLISGAVTYLRRRGESVPSRR